MLPQPQPHSFSIVEMLHSHEIRALCGKNNAHHIEEREYDVNIIDLVRLKLKAIRRPSAEWDNKLKYPPDINTR